MTRKEVQEIYDRLLKLTRAGMVQWKQTGTEEFTTNFSRSSVTVGKDIDYDEPPIFLKIFNANGIMVACAASEEHIEYLDTDYGAKVFNLDPSELFGLVQDEVYKYSETSRSILDELRELELSQKGK